MVDYEALYKKLFNCITDAIDDMDKNNFGLARDELSGIQQEAEEIYLDTED